MPENRDYSDFTGQGGAPVRFRRPPGQEAAPKMASPVTPVEPQTVVPEEVRHPEQAPTVIPEEVRHPEPPPTVVPHQAAETYDPRAHPDNHPARLPPAARPASQGP
jgi:hypothetical protein